MAREFNGRKLGDRYEVLTELGRSSGRRTLLARDLETGDRVAIKVLLFDPDFQWDDLKLFEREAEVLKSLDLPEIPRYLNDFELDEPDCKGFALVQTYIEARSLQQCVRAGRSFSEADLQQLARKLLAILQYLHDRSPAVVHRDLKPSNILLGDRSGHDVGSVYLVDFGSVRAIAAREDSTVTVVGTYGYMPPEQFGGRSVPATDLYALGATLVYLATGERPSDLPQKDLRIQFESRARLSRSFARWLQGMVEPSLDRRFRSAAEALQALDRPSIGSGPPPALDNRPAGSKIALYRDDSRLEIVLPPHGFGWKAIRNGLAAYFFGQFVFFAITPMTLHIYHGLLYSGSPLLVAALLAIALFALAWGLELRLLYRTLFLLFGKVRFRADAWQVSIFWQLWFFRWRARSGARQDISQIVRSQGGIRSAKHGEFSRANRIEVPSEVALWVGTKKYVIGCGPEQTPPELHWLAAELGRFLELPVRDR